jgi:hypothetical protein
MKKLLSIVELLWRYCLLFSFSLASVWIYGSLIEYMRGNSMPEWAIIFTQIVLLLTSIVIIFNIAIGWYKLIRSGE